MFRGCFVFFCCLSLGTFKGLKGASVLSCDLPTDELCHELLFRAGSLERLRGVSPLARNPAWTPLAAKLPLALPLLSLGAPGFLSKAPADMVCSDFHKPAQLALASRLGFKVLCLENWKGFAALERNVRALGSFLSLEKAAQTLLEDMAALRRALRLPPGMPKVQLLFWEESGNTLGRETLWQDILELLGAENPAASKGIQGWALISKAQLRRWNPQYLLLAAPHRKAWKDLCGRLRKDPILGSLRALREGRLLYVEPKYLYAASHHSLRAVWELRAALFPQLGKAVERPSWL